MRQLLLFLVLSLSVRGFSQTKKNGVNTTKSIKRLESQFDKLRIALRIPGMSVAVVKDQQLIWSKGFGFSDLEQHIKATENTPYRIASLTKPIATTLFLQLLEQGKVALDDPLKKYYPKDFETEKVHVRHILTHTAGVSAPGGKPGDKYTYSGSWFGYLGFVVAKGAGKTFRDQLVGQILEPLKMNNSVPGQDVLTAVPSPVDGYTQGTRQRYEQVLGRLAKPYTLYGNENILSPYPPKMISSAAGLISTVADLAKFDIAIDQHKLIKKETQDLAWTQALSNEGQKIPYGLGWFVQEVNGIRLVWHYGQWPVFSGLILKVPEKNITLILLANSTAVSSPFDLDKGDVLNSPFALAFLNAFRINQGPKYLEAKVDSSIQAYLESRIVRVREETAPDLASLDAYVGKYAVDSTHFVTIIRQSNSLMIEYPGQPQNPMNLFAESETQFFAKIADTQVSFERDQYGKVMGLILVTSGKKQRGVRIE